MEFIVLHAGSPRRIRKLNERISAMRIPIEINGKQGHSPVYPYRGEMWFYKVKKEAAPTFLAFMKGNTNEVSRNHRPVQGVLNMASWALKIVAGTRFAFMRLDSWMGRNAPFRWFLKRRENPRLATQMNIFIPDMKSIQAGPKVVPGWSYSKILAGFPDHYGPEGDEQL